MNVDKAFSLLGSIVMLALAATALSPRSQTAKVIGALGDFFTGALRAAKDQDG